MTHLEDYRTFLFYYFCFVFCHNCASFVLYFAANSSHHDRLIYRCLLFRSHCRFDCCFTNVFPTGNNVIKCIKIATVTKILCDNPIYSFKQYAINRCFYLMRNTIWFGISDLYAIKQYMRLSSMRLTDFVCNVFNCKEISIVKSLYFNVTCKLIEFFLQF